MTQDAFDPAAAQVAEAVLARHDLGFAAASRAGGWSNATWQAGDVVVRVARTPGPADLLREARLANLLPAAVGYPDIVDAGILQGHEWVMTRRIPGRTLEDVWPTLSPPQRVTAMEQVWTRAEHIHRMGVSDAAAHVRPRSPFFAQSPEEATAMFDRLAAASLLTKQQVATLRQAMDRFWTALPDAPNVLNHGDLGMCNVLWNDGEIVSLLDFEFAVLGPVHIDLNEILKFALIPGGDNDALQDAATRIAAPVLTGPGGFDVLLGYSIMLEAWLTENELASGTGNGDLADLEPYRLLTALAAGDGGHLSALGG